MALEDDRIGEGSQRMPFGADWVGQLPRGWGNIGISYEMGRLDEVWVGAKSRACSRGTSYLERLKQRCSSIRVLLV